MKLLVTAFIALFSLSSLAHEQLIFDGAQRDFAKGIGDFNTGFYVDQQSGEAGIRVTFTRESTNRDYTKKFPLDNLYLEGDDLMINLDGEIIVCGTMKESKFRKIPTLHLSGNCRTRMVITNVSPWNFFRSQKLITVYLNVDKN